MVEGVSGEAHNQQFQVACAVDSLGVRAFGAGGSRRRAEQAAAESLLESLETLWGGK